MKKFTRILSLALVCVMALCVFTACGGSGSSTSADSYVKALGASDSIQQSDELTAVAKKYASAIQTCVTSGKTDKDSVLSAIKAVDTAGVKVDAYYFEVSAPSQGKDVKYLYSNGSATSDTTAIASTVSSMKTYGKGSSSAYFGMVSINVVTFAK